MAKKTAKKSFYIVDGHAQIFRAYYAPFQLLTAPSGEPVKATHTFTQMLLNIVRDRNPDYLAVALDVSDHTTKRTQLYPEYKANRDETPEDLPPQIDRIVHIIETCRIPIFRVEGYEADDVIATIAEKLKDADVDLYVVSRDKDLYQILSDRVRLWDPVKDEIIGPAELESKQGFRPEEAVEIQTLAGDPIDNVPGVKGVGVKTAAKLVRKYGSAAEVFRHLDELTPKQRENVRSFIEQEPITRKLVTLERNVALDFDLEKCTSQPLPANELRKIFEELGFRRLTAQLENVAPQEEATQIDPLTLDVIPSRTGGDEHPGPPAARPKNGHYSLVGTPEALQSFLQDLRQQECFAIDTETTSLRPVDCELVGLSFSWEAEQGFYLPLRSKTGETLDVQETMSALRPILEDPSVAKCGQNLKFDLQSLRTEGVELAGIQFDSMIGSYLLFPERRGHGMDALSRDLLDHETIPISDLIGKGKNQISLTEVDPLRLADYAGEDADVTWRLCQELRPRIDASPMRSLYYDVELPLVRVLADMEYAGVKVDVERLHSVSRRMEERLAELREAIYKEAGHEFKIDSPKQLAEVLFDEQGLRVVRKTKTSRSTDAEVLATLASETAHALPGLVLEYRELAKLRGTYVDPLPQLVSAKTGRIHPSYHQTVAATGRLSSSDPNIQNIPIRTEQGREIRKAFVAGDADHVLVAADYSQIELRILAHLSHDEALLDAFRNDRDIHAFVAAEIAGIPLSEVSSEQRSQAKAVNFGIIYGQGAWGLARSLGIPQGDAAKFISEYKKRYHGIVRFMESCIEEAERTGRVSTLLGRQRVIPEIQSRNRGQRALGERLAVNTVVQGTAADMIKVAMVRTHARLGREAPHTRLLIQVHDELVLEAPRVHAESIANLVSEEMNSALPLDVPIKVDCGWGDDWLSAKG